MNFYFHIYCFIDNSYFYNFDPISLKILHTMKFQKNFFPIPV